MARSKYFISMVLATTVYFLLHVSICQENPGMQVQIGKPGLDYVNEICLNKIHEELKSSTFQTYSNDMYTLLNMNINHVSMPTGDVKLVPGRELRWDIRIQRYNLSSDLRYDATIFLIKQEHMVSLTMDISLVSLQLAVKATKTSNGGLSLKGVHCDSDVTVQVTSSNTFLKPVVPAVLNKIKSLQKNKLCESAKKIINNNVAQEFSNFPLIRRLKYGYVFDYSFLSDPVFTTTYMLTNHKAVVMAENQTSNFTFSPKPLQKLYADGYMIWFTISNFVLNTWLYTVYRDGKLQLNVTKEKFKTEEQRNILRTYCPESFCIGTFFPNISKDYPNGTVEITFSASREPTVQFTQNMYLEADVESKFNVLTSDGKSVNVLSSTLVLNSELGAKITGSNILFSVITATFKEKTISWLYPADLNDDIIEKFVNIVVHNLQGNLPAIPLPLTLPANTMIKNAKLEILQDAILVASNLTIRPI